MERASAAVKLNITSLEFLERDVKLRMPFRFGVVTLTESPQAFVRCRIRTEDGREAEGAAAELLAPKWFDKNPALSNEDNHEQLRASLRASVTSRTTRARPGRTPRPGRAWWRTTARRCSTAQFWTRWRAASAFRSTRRSKTTS